MRIGCPADRLSLSFGTHPAVARCLETFKPRRRRFKVSSQSALHSFQTPYQQNPDFNNGPRLTPNTSTHHIEHQLLSTPAIRNCCFVPSGRRSALSVPTLSGKVSRLNHSRTQVQSARRSRSVRVVIVEVQRLRDTWMINNGLSTRRLSTY